MEPSPFNILIENSDSQPIAFNCVSGDLLKVSDDVFSYLRGEKDCTNPIDLYKMHQSRFIVSNRKAEYQYVAHMIHHSRFLSRIVGYTACLTYACNLRCPYCYERGADIDQECMTEETAFRLVRHIRAHAWRVGAQAVGLTLYGGEPLLNFRIASWLVRNLREMCDNEHLRLSANLITNGLLVGDSRVRDLLNAVDYVQVTLEGDREYHNTVRTDTKGNGTFDTILASVQSLLRIGKRVIIRIQVSPEGYHSIGSCLESLNHARLLHHPSIQIYFFPILDINKVCSAIAYPCYASYFSPSQLRFLWGLCAIYNLNLFNPPRPVWKGPYCSFINKHFWVVDPVGNLYKCVSALGDSQQIAGSILDGVSTIQQRKWQCNELAFFERTGLDIQECSECSILPICNGGCAYAALSRSGTFLSSYCDMHRDILPLQIQYMAEYRLSQKGPDQPACKTKHSLTPMQNRLKETSDGI